LAESPQAANPRAATTSKYFDIGAPRVTRWWDETGSGVTGFDLRQGAKLLWHIVLSTRHRDVPVSGTHGPAHSPGNRLESARWDRVQDNLIFDNELHP
jgi:hypothetical protein